MANVYPDKDLIAPIGVSQLRKFGGPVDLAITLTTSGDDTEDTDNFPSGLTVDDIFGAIVTLKNTSDVVYKCIANAVYVSSDNIYFSLGSQNFYYDVEASRVKIAS